MSKLKIEVVQKAEAKKEYPNFPFVVKDGDSYWLLSTTENVSIITTTDLINGITNETIYETLDEYFADYPNDKIVDAKITISE